MPNSWSSKSTAFVTLFAVFFIAACNSETSGEKAASNAEAMMMMQRRICQTSARAKTFLRDSWQGSFLSKSSFGFVPSEFFMR
jgi:hypothetical protein